MTDMTRRDFVATTAGVAGASLLSPLADRFGGHLDAAPAIPVRPFGRTGVDVTMIGLGGGSRFYIPVQDDEQGAEIVRRAVARGIRFIETASSYGADGLSERRIGMALKTLRPQVFLETKVDSRDYDGAMREIEASLKHLQTDTIDLMLHHWVRRKEEIDHIVAKDGAEAAIRKMVDQKVIRFRGFSCHNPELTLDGLTRIEPQAIQMIANATRNPDFESQVLPLTKEKGIAVVVMKAVGKGYFLPTHFTKPDRIDQFGPPAGVFEEHRNLPTAKEFLWYSLSLPAVSAIVVGLDCLETLDAVVRDVQGFKPMTAAEMGQVSRRAQPLSKAGFWLPGMPTA
jgi:aryl-alcohol dehydrogenase-like predicted oxidoreductase